MECFYLTTKVKVYALEESPLEIKKLIKSAKKSATNAYAPYSQYCVGAAVLLENGNIISGNNQENAAYPSGQCAERTAIFYANAQHPKEPIIAIAIAAYNIDRFTENICSPCGACRQVLAEVETRFGKPVRIIMYGEKHIYEVTSVKDLLPLLWDSEKLITKV